MLTQTAFSLVYGNKYTWPQTQTTKITAPTAYVKNFFPEQAINVWNSLPSNENFILLTAFKQSMIKVDFGSYIMLFIN